MNRSSAALLMEFLNTPEKRDRRMVHIPMGALALVLAMLVS